jgi:hypothetical protein
MCRLNDKCLLGVFAALASHPADLIENLFCSRSSDFKQYGVYTCRFFKEGEWTEVVCDTRIPSLSTAGSSSENPVYAPAYGVSVAPGEQWVALLQKAYAKMKGCYEALHDISISCALLELTGGVTKQIALQDNYVRQLVETGHLFDELAELKPGEHVLLCELVTNRKAPAGTGIVANHPYVIHRVVEVSGHKLVFLHNPWETGRWMGKWNKEDIAWENWPEVHSNVSEDKVLKQTWSRSDPHSLCMEFDDFCETFSMLYACRLFSPEHRQYTLLGCWRGRQAGGPVTNIAESGEEKEDDCSGVKRPVHYIGTPPNPVRTLCRKPYLL